MRKLGLTSHHDWIASAISHNSVIPFMSLKTKAESLAFYMGIGLGDNSIRARALCWWGHSETFESRAFSTPVMVAILGNSKVTKHTQLNCSHFSDAFSTRWFAPFKHIPGFAINRASLLPLPIPIRSLSRQPFCKTQNQGEKQLNQTQIKSSDRKLQQSPHKESSLLLNKNIDIAI